MKKNGLRTKQYVMNVDGTSEDGVFGESTVSSVENEVLGVHCPPNPVSCENKAAFVSEVLDDFLENDSVLKISFEVPRLEAVDTVTHYDSQDETETECPGKRIVGDCKEHTGLMNRFRASGSGKTVNHRTVPWAEHLVFGSQYSCTSTDTASRQRPPCLRPINVSYYNENSVDSESENEAENHHLKANQLHPEGRPSSSTTEKHHMKTRQLHLRRPRGRPPSRKVSKLTSSDKKHSVSNSRCRRPSDFQKRLLNTGRKQADESMLLTSATKKIEGQCKKTERDKHTFILKKGFEWPPKAAAVKVGMDTQAKSESRNKPEMDIEMRVPFVTDVGKQPSIPEQRQPYHIRNDTSYIDSHRARFAASAVLSANWNSDTSPQQKMSLPSQCDQLILPSSQQEHQPLPTQQVDYQLGSRLFRLLHGKSESSDCLVQAIAAANIFPDLTLLPENHAQVVNWCLLKNLFSKNEIFVWVREPNNTPKVLVTNSSKKPYALFYNLKSLPMLQGLPLIVRSLVTAENEVPEKIQNCYIILRCDGRCWEIAGTFPDSPEKALSDCTSPNYGTSAFANLRASEDPTTFRTRVLASLSGCVTGNLYFQLAQNVTVHDETAEVMAGVYTLPRGANKFRWFSVPLIRRYDVAYVKPKHCYIDYDEMEDMLFKAMQNKVVLCKPLLERRAGYASVSQLSFIKFGVYADSAVPRKLLFGPYTESEAHHITLHCYVDLRPKKFVLTGVGPDSIISDVCIPPLNSSPQLMKQSQTGSQRVSSVLPPMMPVFGCIDAVCNPNRTVSFQHPLIEEKKLTFGDVGAIDVDNNKRNPNAYNQETKINISSCGSEFDDYLFEDKQSCKAENRARNSKNNPGNIGMSKKRYVKTKENDSEVQPEFTIQLIDKTFLKENKHDAEHSDSDITIERIPSDLHASNSYLKEKPASKVPSSAEIVIERIKIPDDGTEENRKSSVTQSTNVISGCEKLFAKCVTNDQKMGNVPKIPRYQHQERLLLPFTDTKPRKSQRPEINRKHMESDKPISTVFCDSNKMLFRSSSGYSLPGLAKPVTVPSSKSTPLPSSSIPVYTPRSIRIPPPILSHAPAISRTKIVSPRTFVPVNTLRIPAPVTAVSPKGVPIPAAKQVPSSTPALTSFSVPVSKAGVILTPSLIKPTITLNKNTTFRASLPSGHQKNYPLYGRVVSNRDVGFTKIERSGRITMQPRDQAVGNKTVSFTAGRK